MSTAYTATESADTDEAAPDGTITPDADTDGAEANSEPDTFPREVVEKLRKESAGYRDRAKTAEARADELARALWNARVTATGKVVNPAEIPYCADILDDTDAISSTVDDAIQDRPYIAARKVTGDAGQGHRGDNPTAPTFADLLRS